MNRQTIAMKDVHYIYPDDTAALQGVAFKVVQGETVALIGGNGAGKSTLLSLLVGIMFPTSGTVTIGEMDLNRKNATTVRHKVGMVFQNPDDQLFMPTVYDDVAFGPLNMGISAERTRQLVAESLTIVGAAHLEKRSSHRLSIGEKRVVSIACVLSMSPDILLMDEPTSGLDPWSRRQLICLLQKVAQTRIVATHDLDFALDVCNRTLVMHKGRVVADGPTDEILRNQELLNRCHLELPLRLQ